MKENDNVDCRRKKINTNKYNTMQREIKLLDLGYTVISFNRTTKTLLIAISIALFLLNSHYIFNAYAQHSGSATSGSATSGNAISGNATSGGGNLTSSSPSVSHNPSVTVSG